MSVSADGTLRIWDVESGKCVRVVKVDEPGSVDFTLDGYGAP